MKFERNRDSQISCDQRGLESRRVITSVIWQARLLAPSPHSAAMPTHDTHITHCRVRIERSMGRISAMCGQPIHSASLRWGRSAREPLQRAPAKRDRTGDHREAGADGLWHMPNRSRTLHHRDDSEAVACKTLRHEDDLARPVKKALLRMYGLLPRDAKQGRSQQKKWPRTSSS